MIFENLFSIINKLVWILQQIISLWNGFLISRFSYQNQNDSKNFKFDKKSLIPYFLPGILLMYLAIRLNL